MNTPLFHDKVILHCLLEKTRSVATHYFDQQESLPPGRFVENIAMSDLPDDGEGAESVLEEYERTIANHIANTAGPRYFGFVTGGSTPAAVMGDWLVSAIDQNAFSSNDSIAPQIEKQAIHFLKQLLQLDDDYFGSFVTGATLSNFVNLATARQWVGLQEGKDFSNDGITENITILSGTPHSSVYKSLSMLGIGRKSLIKIKTLPGREAVDVQALEKTLQEQTKPVIVVANAGTANIVDFDDLEAIGSLKKKYNFWLHVDAAFGGFAACSEKYSHFVKGINAADSITTDAHKWLNVPYDSAMQFNRHPSIQGQVFQNKAPYLGGELNNDFLHYTPENSRRFRALPAWFTLKAYGRNGYKEIIERNCALAFELGQLIDLSDNFVLLAPVRMNVVCFTVQEETATFDDILRFLDRVRDDGRAFFTPTVFNGRPAIRAAVSNWMTTAQDIKIAFQALSEVYEHERLTITK